MKIENITLENFRKYEAASFQFHAKFTLLIGNNGTGKTTVLDAIAILMNTYFLGSKIPTGGGTIKDQDARFVFTKKEEQIFKEQRDNVSLEASGRMGEHFIKWRREIGDRGAKAKNFAQLGAQGRDQIKEQKTPELPLLLYYGAGRLWSLHDDVETNKPSSQLDAYRYCLDPKSDQKAFEKWFKQLAFVELQKRTTIPAVTAVRQAVKDCIPGAQDFYHDTEYDQLIIQLEKEGITPFNSLSDGYRNMVAMVADIAHRASRLNPHHGTEAARKTTGVVLIDEIDLHLHPKWQRRVVGDLQRAFPNLQFIATTHSPFILQSMQPGQVIDLDRVSSSTGDLHAPEGVAAPGPGSDFSNRAIEDIVESVMGIPLPQRSERHQKMYKAAQAYYSALRQAEQASGPELDALKTRLDELSAPFSDDVAYHAFLEMERLAAGLGRSRPAPGAV